MNGFKAIIIIISLPVLLLIGIYYMDLAYLKSEVPVKYFHELTDWVHKNIEYKSDNIEVNDVITISRDHWQYPCETLLCRSGDCDDQVILFVYLAKKLLHRDCKAVWLKDASGILGHMTVLYEGLIFDPTWNVEKISNQYFCYYGGYVYKVYTWNELLKEIPRRRNLIFKY